MSIPVQDFKEQVAELRRTQILTGAAQIFAEKGFHKATTREIAKAAGVSEGTIYNYFNSKRDLLIAMIELWAGQSLKRVIDQPAADPRQFLRLILKDRYQLLQERGYLLVPIIAEIFADVDLRKEVYQRIVKPITAQVEQYLQVHIDAGHLRQIDPLIITRALMGAMILNSALKFTNLDPRYEAISADLLIEQLISLFLDGLFLE